ncbi:ABC transporter substrate-binding protein [Natronincola ferrireducens]|uniref:Peptide/nickel transport system substrate-binding protein n=1 Tax=Natronincola ferrireducens TaxID=393762 RepID=A0A1G9F510_9FIRM|nr:ABC transporter substrate-binding protein [Natronincola ferrireducens]SDK83482.1 peptide/nickel transport system substrate-binding protein [Natronincola ferrireducens]
MKKQSWKRKLSIFLLIGILILSGFLMTACGGGQQTAQGEEGQPRIAFYATANEPILDFDPSVEFSNGIVVLHNIYETLLKYEALEDKVVPVLATDYSVSEDGLIWEFNIREGVKFHDGSDLNAEAVKLSIERTINMDQGAAYIWHPVEEINVVDTYKVEFKLSYPAPLDLIASAGYAGFIMSPAATEEASNWFAQGNTAGTGPYTIDSFKMGEEVVLKVFEDYWKGWEGNYFDKVFFKRVAEASSRRLLLERGEVDFVSMLPYEDLEVLKNNPNLDLIVGPSYQNLFFKFNTEKEPLNNKLVRQAISYAFPYGDVMEYAVGGYATQARGAVPLGHWGHGEDLYQYEHNIEKAKALLKEAGYEDGGFTITITYAAGDETQKNAAELFMAELDKLNINLEIRGMPWESQWELSRSSSLDRRQDILVMYWWPDFASPYGWLYSMFHTEEDILFNLAYWSNEEFDNLIDEANVISSTDRDRAEEMFIEAQKILVEEAPSIFVYDMQYAWIANKTFKGVKNNPVYPNVVFFHETYRQQ